MKKKVFLCITFVGAVIILLSSCNNEEKECTKETEGITMGVNHSSQRVIPNALATAFFMNALMVIPSFWAAIATPL